MKWLVLTAGVAFAGCADPALPVLPPWSEGPPMPVGRIEAGVTAVGDQLVVIGGFTDASTITGEVDVFNTSLGSDATWVRSGDDSPQAIPTFPQEWTHFQIAAIGTRIYVLGGLSGGYNFTDYVAHGDSYMFDTSVQDPAQRVWVPLSPLPAGQERGSSAVVISPPRIYLLGGAASSTPDPRAGALASNLFYDTQTDTWCPGGSADACPPDDVIPDLPAPRSHPAGIRMQDGTLVVAGGLSTLFSTDPTADVWWLPPHMQGQTSTWITKTSSPDARGGCASGSIGGRLICAGGESSCSQNACALHTAYAYAPSLDGATPDHPWCRLTDLPVLRAGAPGAAIGDRLFVAGGADAIQLDPTATLLIYSSADDPALNPIDDPDTGSDTKLCPI